MTTDCPRPRLASDGMSLPNPWRQLNALAHITLRWHSGGVRGRCWHSTQVISLRSDLNQAERRSALAHELTHLERGPAIVGYVVSDETATTREAARRLIPFDRLVEAMLWASDDYELADELWVDVHTARARLASLTAAESADLRERMLTAERAFPIY